ncbi:ATP-binding protein, partial [Clostridioides difficile]|uniref:ATP-binding protein n=1 Tax=Clostridioides difficile TaxID=1496 RepID=UPI002ED3B9F8
MRVRQIVLNLLVNAINFTPAGVVALRVRYVAARHGRSGVLRFEVRDSGIGIAPDRIGHVFDAYWQAGRS